MSLADQVRDLRDVPQLVHHPGRLPCVRHEHAVQPAGDLHPGVRHRLLLQRLVLHTVSTTLNQSAAALNRYTVYVALDGENNIFVRLPTRVNYRYVS